MKRLKVGRIPFGNLFPIFYILERDFDCSDFHFVDGVPSMLNKLLRNGEIDLSPSSSIEYLNHKDLYTYISGHSISSRGKAGSIFLFTQKLLSQMDGEIVQVTNQSATSIGLLKVISRRFYNVRLKLVESSTPQRGNNPFLLIGDDALLQLKVENRGYKIYDLGELWYEHTGLPFVFALWIVRKDNIFGEKVKIFNNFKSNLDKAKDIALTNIRDLASLTPLKQFMTQEEIIEYWNKLDYDLTDKHLEGLKLYDSLLEEGDK